MVKAKKLQLKIKTNLPVSILKEGKYFVAYTPVLDLSTSGKSFEEVKQRFTEVVKLFIEELLEKGTLDEVLTGLGWQKVKREWMPPFLVAQESESFRLPISS